ncbi:hypothetical protein Tco_1002991 [Tanacetum coccineum]|uniref:Uncharacterized protein n=1 Tax=Tanacetum coccineum TaxID=301880 RepID=A0ABQ5F7U5_9ASTR
MMVMGGVCGYGWEGGWLGGWGWVGVGLGCGLVFGFGVGGGGGVGLVEGLGGFCGGYSLWREVGVEVVGVGEGVGGAEGGVKGCLGKLLKQEGDAGGESENLTKGGSRGHDRRPKGWGWRGREEDERRFGIPMVGRGLMGSHGYDLDNIECDGKDGGEIAVDEALGVECSLGDDLAIRPVVYD